MVCFQPLILSGCSSHAQRVDHSAAALGFVIETAQSTDFKHRLYRNRQGIEGDGILHVYLEGDGSPWVGNQSVIAADPTPRSPLMLKLMAMDRSPALYLGRPCYHGFASTSACHPELWTHARYSERVVNSMQEVLIDRLNQEGADTLVLMGHSGGGVLATLLAERLPQTRVLVTVAANLDIDAWADLHAYSRLNGSLNPATGVVLDSGVQQLHLAGGRDLNVPPSLLQSYLNQQDLAQFIVMKDFGHVCCWEKLWLEVLGWITETISTDTYPLQKNFRSH